jgi:hypothetical protein
VPGYWGMFTIPIGDGVNFYHQCISQDQGYSQFLQLNNSCVCKHDTSSRRKHLGAATQNLLVLSKWFPSHRALFTRYGNQKKVSLSKNLIFQKKEQHQSQQQA